MPTLLPRESIDATSVFPAPIQRPSPSDHRVGFSSMFTRLLIGSLAFRPALLLFGNSRPRVATTPLPHATGAYGQLPRRDFNPLDLLLLLRTVSFAFPFRTYVIFIPSSSEAKIGLQSHVGRLVSFACRSSRLLLRAPDAQCGTNLVTETALSQRLSL